jgi:hypothetical protein
MVHAFYGQYYLLIKTVEDTDIDDGKVMSLKNFISQKPQLAERLLGKIEDIVQKLVEKGMSRHSIV